MKVCRRARVADDAVEVGGDIRSAAVRRTNGIAIGRRSGLVAGKGVVVCSERSGLVVDSTASACGTLSSIIGESTIGDTIAVALCSYQTAAISGCCIS